jgi:hypothetical protein
MENRIKECQLDLFADQTSTATTQANQLRPWFASMAYVLLCALRRIGLAHTQFAEAACGTIRLKLLKLGALVQVSVRRIKIAMASACPSQDAFALPSSGLSTKLQMAKPWPASPRRDCATPSPDQNQTARRQCHPNRGESGAWSRSAGSESALRRHNGVRSEEAMSAPRLPVSIRHAG